jgi:hypothetical protein
MGEYNAPLMASKRKWKQHGEAARGSATGCRTRPVRRRHRRDPLLLGRRHESLRRRLPDEHRLDPGRPAVAGRLGQLRPGHREREPARVRRDVKTIPAKSSTGRATGAGLHAGDRIKARRCQRTRSRSGTCRRPGITDARQRASWPSLTELNRGTLATRREQTELDARIAATNWPSACRPPRPRRSISQETEETRSSCTAWTSQGDRLLRPHVPAGPAAGRARRAVRAALSRRRQQVGRAFQHRGKNHAGCAARWTKPVAGLLKRPEARGLLDETLVVWGGEFGRTPMSEKGRRPRPQPYGFTMWMAGGGVRGGQTIGAPTNSACTPSRTACTSTTCTPRSCTCWASTTCS